MNYLDYNQRTKENEKYEKGLRDMEDRMRRYKYNFHPQFQKKRAKRTKKRQH